MFSCPERTRYQAFRVVLPYDHGRAEVHLWGMFVSGGHRVCSRLQQIVDGCGEGIFR